MEAEVKPVEINLYERYSEQGRRRDRRVFYQVRAGENKDVCGSVEGDSNLEAEIENLTSQVLQAVKREKLFSEEDKSRPVVVSSVIPQKTEEEIQIEYSKLPKEYLSCFFSKFSGFGEVL
jgi:hypothetical protein